MDFYSSNSEDIQRCSERSCRQLEAVIKETALVAEGGPTWYFHCWGTR